MTEILKVKDLRISFFTHVGEVKAIRGINFSVEKGQIVGIVGESGSGKSVTSLSVMGLLQQPGRVTGGEILFKGENLLKKSKRDMVNLRGNEISMIFQDPMTSMNPVYTVGRQIEEAISNHMKLSREELRAKTIEMLDLVKIPSPEQRVKNYPHEFSGGMRQRAMIAMALACGPDLLIADEPTTALDVTIQAQIVKLMKDINRELNTSIIFITHDLGVVADICQRVIVMYGGLIMEEGTVDEIFYKPRHPYTMGLLHSIPEVSSGEKTRLIPIKGTPPDLLNPPPGCPFFDRCEYAMEICRKKQPPYFEESEGHRTMCWLLHPDAPSNSRYEKQKGGVDVGM